MLGVSNAFYHLWFVWVAEIWENRISLEHLKEENQLTTCWIRKVPTTVCLTWCHKSRVEVIPRYTAKCCYGNETVSGEMDTPTWWTVLSSTGYWKQKDNCMFNMTTAFTSRADFHIFQIEILWWQWKAKTLELKYVVTEISVVTKFTKNFAYMFYLGLFL